MTTRKAISLAIRALEIERQKLAVDANMADIYHADYPAAVNASKRRKEINEAIEILQGMKK